MSAAISGPKSSEFADWFSAPLGRQCGPARDVLRSPVGDEVRPLMTDDTPAGQNIISGVGGEKVFLARADQRWRQVGRPGRRFCWLDLFQLKEPCSH